MSATVSLAHCPDYDRPTLRRALLHAWEHLPGASDMLRGGRVVLLKPNLVTPRPPERAVCTHPELVRVVAELVIAAGGRVIVADQPSYYLTGRADQVFAEAGYVEALRGLEVEFRLLGAAGFTAVELPGHNQWPVIHSAALLREADLVINLAKCKTHMQTLYSGAVKNMFGALAPRQRIETHALGGYPAVSGAVADAFGAFLPQLNLMDGILAMEGSGPSQGRARPWGALLAATDAVALDAVAEDLIGFHPGEVLSTPLAAAQGWGEADLPQITLTGDDPAPLRTRFVQPPRMMRQFPPALGKLIRRLVYVRPRVRRSDCIACGGCAQVCPVQAIAVEDYAVVDYAKCIECFCCTEACPKDAIAVHRSPLARLTSSSV